MIINLFTVLYCKIGRTLSAYLLHDNELEKHIKFSAMKILFSTKCVYMSNGMKNIKWNHMNKILSNRNNLFYSIQTVGSVHEISHTDMIYWGEQIMWPSGNCSIFRDRLVYRYDILKVRCFQCHFSSGRRKTDINMEILMAIGALLIILQILHGKYWHMYV